MLESITTINHGLTVDTLGQESDALFAGMVPSSVQVVCLERGTKLYRFFERVKPSTMTGRWWFSQQIYDQFPRWRSSLRLGESAFHLGARSLLAITPEFSAADALCCAEVRSDVALLVFQGRGRLQLSRGPLAIRTDADGNKTIDETIPQNVIYPGIDFASKSSVGQIFIPFHYQCEGPTTSFETLFSQYLVKRWSQALQLTS